MINNFTDIHPRIVKSNPWTSTDDSLNELIDKIIISVHPNLPRGMVDNVLNDWDNRELAIEVLQDKLLNMKGNNDN